MSLQIFDKGGTVDMVLHRSHAKRNIPNAELSQTHSVGNYVFGNPGVRKEGIRNDQEPNRLRSSFGNKKD